MSTTMPDPIQTALLTTLLRRTARISIRNWTRFIIIRILRGKLLSEGTIHSERG
jgi:hypothetical protein